MSLTTVLATLVAFAAPSLQQSWGNVEPVTVAVGSSFNDGLTGNQHRRDFSCYRPCYEVYINNPRNFHNVRGCDCTIFDFSRRGGSINNNNNNNNRYCDCPAGTTCVIEFGRQVCERIPNVRRPGPITANRHCGTLTPTCRSFVGVLRYTYNYVLQRCVQVRIHSSCAHSFKHGDNIFRTRRSCSSQCRFNIF